MKAFFFRHKKLHLWLLFDAAFLVLFLFARQNRAWMNALTSCLTDPLRRAVGSLCERVPFSLAELFYVLLAVGLLAFFARGVRAVLRSRHRGETVYAHALALLAFFASVYAAFCLLWGANYYADSFCDKSGLSAEPVAIEDLLCVTQHFASLVNDTVGAVPRESDGSYAGEREAILAYAPHIYVPLYDEFPFLAMEDVSPKPIYFSKLMSAMGFTGFYFPFTGESNVNMDFPAATLPTTVAHELSHRRGIASEQECNFLAILASLRSEDALYRYAGALSGYIHLSNALYSADPALWREVRETLDGRALGDLRASSAYWAQYEGIVEKATTTVYDGLLKSYGSIGVKSYGACVDLLVSYFK